MPNPTRPSDATSADPAPPVRQRQWWLGLLLALSLLYLWIAFAGGLWPGPARFIAPEDQHLVGALRRAKLIGMVFVWLTHVPMVVAVLGAALGMGYPVVTWLARSMRCRLMAQMGIGLAVFMWVNWLLAWAGMLNRATAWGMVLLGCGILLGQIAQARRVANDGAPNEPRFARWQWMVLAAIPAVAALLVAASCPPGTVWAVEASGYDVLSYHLELPREWMALGQMRGLTHNVYSFFPSLAEVAYMHLGLLRGSMYDATYAAQFLHAGSAVLAAVALGSVAARWCHPVLAAATGALLAAIPWTVVTGAMAYDENFAQFLGAVALLVIFAPRVAHVRAAVLVGMLVGAATLIKLTAGPNYAVPLGLLVVVRPWLVGDVGEGASDTRPAEAGRAERRGAGRVRAGVVGALVAAAVGMATLMPYFVRNAVQTGNPVFPFLANKLGAAHWTGSEVERWNRGHHYEATARERGAALYQHWLGNTGYGAVLGAARDRNDPKNVAHFHTENGMSLLWVAAGVGLLLAVAHGPTRGPALALVLMLGAQLLFWLYGTHLQSRFLIPTLLPGCLLVGLGWEALRARVAGRWHPWVFAGAGVLTVVMAHVALSVFHRQTISINIGGRSENIPPWRLVDELMPRDLGREIPLGAFLAGDHPLNRLPAGSKVLLVADNTRLYYIQTPMVYNTAFDVNPLGVLLRQYGHDGAQVTAALRARGVTHVWVLMSELGRLMGTYGFDADVTPATLQRLAEEGRWMRVDGEAGAGGVLFALPGGGM